MLIKDDDKPCVNLIKDDDKPCVKLIKDDDSCQVKPLKHDTLHHLYVSLHFIIITFSEVWVEFVTDISVIFTYLYKYKLDLSYK